MEKSCSLNAWVSPPEKIMKGVVARAVIVMEVPTPRFEVVMVLDDATDLLEVNKNRSLIRDFVKIKQSQYGSDLNFKYMGNLYRLLRWHNEEKMGWQKLTTFLNYICVVLTLGAYESDQSSDIKMVLNEKQDLISNPGFLELEGYMLLCMYYAFGKTTKDFDKWMRPAFEFLNEKELPINNLDQPFPQTLVRDKLRYLQNRINKKDIFISDQDKVWNILDLEIHSLNQNGCFIRANELLDNAGFPSWKNNRTWIKDMVLKIIKNVETAENPTIVQVREIINERQKNR